MAGPIKRRHNTACSAKQECQGRRRAWVNGAVAISNCLIVSGQGACVFILPWAYAKYVASPPNRTQKHSTHPSGGYTWRTLGPRVESGWPNQAAIWMEKDDSGGCGGGGGDVLSSLKMTLKADCTYWWEFLLERRKRPDDKQAFYYSAEMLSPTSGGTEPAPPLTSPASRPGNVELFRLQAQRQCLQRHTDVMLCFWYCEAGDLVYPSRMFKRT